MKENLALDWRMWAGSLYAFWFMFGGDMVMMKLFADRIPKLEHAAIATYLAYMTGFLVISNLPRVW